MREKLLDGQKIIDLANEIMDVLKLENKSKMLNMILFLTEDFELKVTINYLEDKEVMEEEKIFNEEMVEKVYLILRDKINNLPTYAKSMKIYFEKLNFLKIECSFFASEMSENI
jgi:hypothetical protein